MKSRERDCINCCSSSISMNAGHSVQEEPGEEPPHEFPQNEGKLCSPHLAQLPHFHSFLLSCTWYVTLIRSKLFVASWLQAEVRGRHVGDRVGHEEAQALIGSSQTGRRLRRERACHSRVHRMKSCAEITLQLSLGTKLYVICDSGATQPALGRVRATFPNGRSCRGTRGETADKSFFHAVSLGLSLRLYALPKMTPAQLFF